MRLLFILALVACAPSESWQTCAEVRVEPWTTCYFAGFHRYCVEYESQRCERWEETK